jgi:hypothetical protein
MLSPKPVIVRETEVRRTPFLEAARSIDLCHLKKSTIFVVKSI